ncbi:hypothetical protein ColLi_02109 [Colletotrichum liriopes]|uniref:Uncharacterized protein n=1 Tax=Colletotrichum liriopes TaxID=708192 RepID=A0AA37LNZ3_9PEZI|nr:hypothetical protein ColLi_02109 [Colletotrichum liriopes]
MSGVHLLGAGGGDVLAQVGSRNDHLGLADVVVLQEDDLEQIANVLVLVDDGTDIVDQMNDLLGHPVARRSLSAKDGDARRRLLAVLGRHGLEGEVTMDDTKDVHLLALVLVDTLDLDVEERRGPTPRGDAVGDVGELVGAVDVDEVLENGGLDEVGVQLSYAVDLVGTDNGQECHADHLGLRLLDNGDPAEEVSVVGEHLLDALEEEEIDVVNNLQVSGKQVLDQANGPLLQSLGKNRVVGVAERGSDDVPRLVPFQLLEVHQDALQLDNGERGMGVVQLDGHLVGELPPGTLGLLEATDDVVEGRGTPEVLLLQAELLSTLEIVVGVQDSADGLGALLVGDRVFVVAAIELLEIKLAAGGLAGPQTQVVGGGGRVTRNRHVVCYGRDGLAALPGSDGLSAGVCRLLDVTEELDLGSYARCLGGPTHVHGDIVARELPGVEVKPVVGNLDLVAVDDLLLEDTVPVSQSVAPGGEVEGSQTVKETSSQPAKTTVSECSIVLLLNNVLNAETEFVEASCESISIFGSRPRLVVLLTLGNVLQADVQHGVVEGATHEELEREVVDALSVDEGLALLSLVPLLDQTVTEGQAGGGVGSCLIAVEHAASQSGFDMADHLRFELVLALERSGLSLGPCGALRLWDRSC